MNTSVRRWLIAFGCCVGFAIVCAAYLDRPIADYANAQFRGTIVFAIAAELLRPLRVVGAALLIALILARRRHLVWSALGALVAALVLKFAIGRSQVVPMYLIKHVYEFRPFHGSEDYAAFPSATMAVSGAMLAVLWLLVPRLRILWVFILLLLAMALVVTSSHWTGDIVAGTFLGAFVAWLVARNSPRTFDQHQHPGLVSP